MLARISLCVLILLAAGRAIADDSVVPAIDLVAQKEYYTLKVGRYSGGRRIKNLTIAHAGNGGYLLTGTVHYGSHVKLTVDVTRVGRDYEGQGMIRQYWTDGSACEYYVTVVLHPKGNELMIDYWRPKTLWSELPVGGSCTPLPDGHAWAPMDVPFVLESSVIH